MITIEYLQTLNLLKFWKCLYFPYLSPSIAPVRRMPRWQIMKKTVDKVPYHEKYLNLSAGPRWNSLHSRAQEKGRGVNKGERSPSLLSLTLFRSSDNWGLDLHCHHHYHYLQIIGDWKYVAILSIISDNRGLEIRCHGDGSPLSVDLHRCRPCWHCWHYTSGGRWWHWW